MLFKITILLVTVAVTTQRRLPVEQSGIEAILESLKSRDSSLNAHHQTRNLQYSNRGYLYPRYQDRDNSLPKSQFHTVNIVLNRNRLRNVLSNDRCGKGDRSCSWDGKVARCGCGKSSSRVLNDDDRQDQDDVDRLLRDEVNDGVRLDQDELSRLLNDVTKDVYDDGRENLVNEVARELNDDERQNHYQVRHLYADASREEDGRDQERTIHLGLNERSGLKAPNNLLDKLDTYKKYRVDENLDVIIVDLNQLDDLLSDTNKRSKNRHNSLAPDDDDDDISLDYVHGENRGLHYLNGLDLKKIYPIGVPHYDSLKHSRSRRSAKTREYGVPFELQLDGLAQVNQ